MLRNDQMIMNNQIVMIDSTQIVPGNNDRTVFNQSDLGKLAQNIKQNGLIQPITIRQLDGTELYQIVAGERRYRAMQILGWDEIPCIVADLTDKEAAIIMLAENTSRADIDPIDEGRAYATRIDRFGWTVADCAQYAGVTEIRVQFRIKLLKLPLHIQESVRTGILGIGYAQVLADAGIDSAHCMVAFAKLRDNPRPTIGWFRSIVNDLLARQSQPEMFETMPILTGQPITGKCKDLINEPPHPSNTVPKISGKTVKEIIGGQISFWNDAAEAWQRIGKPFKRQECQAAAQALQFALSSF